MSPNKSKTLEQSIPSNATKNLPRRIVLTGGPGAGKTTAADLLRREIGDQLVIVPEAATMLFSGGFPRCRSNFAVKATQRAIYHVQKNLEDIQALNFPSRILLCDRGTVDSSIYWPEGPEKFFHELQTSLEAELHRYDAVVFFETAAAGNMSIEGGNPIRSESLQEALELDKRLQEIWRQHENFYFIPHETSFLKKINKACHCLENLVSSF